MKNPSVKFVIVGILNTIVGLSVYTVYLKFIQDNYLQALILSHVIGVAHSYLWNNRWTFQQKRYNAKSGMKFMLVYIITFLLTYFY